MYCETLNPLASNRLSIDMKIREELVCGLKTSTKKKKERNY